MYYRTSVSKNQDRGWSAAFTFDIWGSLLLPSPIRESWGAIQYSHWVVLPCTPKSLFITLLVSLKWKVVVGKKKKGGRVA
jgi:hypothetical protein